MANRLLVGSALTITEGYESEYSTALGEIVAELGVAIRHTSGDEDFYALTDILDAIKNKLDALDTKDDALDVKDDALDSALDALEARVGALEE